MWCFNSVVGVQNSGQWLLQRRSAAGENYGSVPWRANIPFLRDVEPANTISNCRLTGIHFSVQHRITSRIGSKRVLSAFHHQDWAFSKSVERDGFRHESSLTVRTWLTSSPDSELNKWLRHRSHFDRGNEDCCASKRSSFQLLTTSRETVLLNLCVEWLFIFAAILRSPIDTE